MRIAQRNDKTGKVSTALIPTKDEALRQYFIATGNRLKEDPMYGQDPLKDRMDLQILREKKYYDVFVGDKEIFESIMGKFPKNFENALCLFQNITMDLALGI